MKLVDSVVHLMHSVLYPVIFLNFIAFIEKSKNLSVEQSSHGTGLPVVPNRLGND